VNRISSRTTFFYKRIFPVLWFGFAIAYFPYIGMVRYSHHAPPDAFAIMPYIVLPLVLVAFGCWSMKKKVLNVADEVLDAGDALVVRRDGQEQRIAFSDIKNVSYAPGGKWPGNVTLSVRQPTVFGDSITFYAPMDTTSTGSPVVGDLTDRAAAASRI
jgi:hypothetical protein